MPDEPRELNPVVFMRNDEYPTVDKDYRPKAIADEKVTHPSGQEFANSSTKPVQIPEDPSENPVGEVVEPSLMSTGQSSLLENLAPRTPKSSPDNSP